MSKKNTISGGGSAKGGSLPSSLLHSSLNTPKDGAPDKSGGSSYKPPIVGDGSAHGGGSGHNPPGGGSSHVGGSGHNPPGGGSSHVGGSGHNPPGGGSAHGGGSSHNPPGGGSAHGGGSNHNPPGGGSAHGGGSGHNLPGGGSAHGGGSGNNPPGGGSAHGGGSDHNPPGGGSVHGGGSGHNPPGGGSAHGGGSGNNPPGGGSAHGGGSGNNPPGGGSAHGGGSGNNPPGGGSAHGGGSGNPPGGGSVHGGGSGHNPPGGGSSHGGGSGHNPPGGGSSHGGGSGHNPPGGGSAHGGGTGHNPPGGGSAHGGGSGHNPPGGGSAHGGGSGHNPPGGGSSHGGGSGHNPPGGGSAHGGGSGHNPPGGGSAHGGGSGHNLAPTACDDANFIKEDASPNNVMGNVLVNDSDSNGDTLTVTSAGAFTLAHGSLVINADGSYTYTLNNSDPAVNALNDGDMLKETFTYSISDGKGGTDSAKLDITIKGTTDNTKPVAYDDSAFIKEDASPNKVMGNVLTNDSDPNGDPLTVTSVGAFTLAHGSLVINADGSYTYTLNNNDPAVNALNDGDMLKETFTYSISDGKGGTDSANLNITIKGTTDNTKPVACDDANFIKEDTSPNKVMGNVLVNDSDPNGDTLTVTSVGAFTLAHGSLVINADGSYTYTLNNNDPAVNALNDGNTLKETFTYSISDGKGGTDSAKLDITIKGTTDNAKPVAYDDSAFIKEDASPNKVMGNVLINDSDPNGDTLAVTSVGTFSLDHGSLVINADGSYTYTLNNNDPAVNTLNDGNTLKETFTYSISDGKGGTDSAKLNITIKGTTDNGRPVACDDSAFIKEDASPNKVMGNVLINDSDPNGDALTVTSVGAFTLAHGSLVINADGSYTYTLNNSDPTVNALNDGDMLKESFTYSISDEKGGTDSAKLDITIKGTTDNNNNDDCGCGSTPPGAAPSAPTNTVFGTVLGDTLFGKDAFVNTIYAGAGNDTVTGGKDATNIIYAESGQDVIKGGLHSINELYGASGANKLIGGDCSINNIFGGGGDAIIHGGNDGSINTMYAGGGKVTLVGGNDSTNTFYAEWGNGVVVTGGNNAQNTFFDGGGNATYFGGTDDNLFIFNDLKYPTGSQGIQGNKVFPVALTNQDVIHSFEYVSNGTDVVHGNEATTQNVIGLIGRLDINTWAITVNNPGSGVHTPDGTWVANTGQTLSGTITNTVNNEHITFDSINKIMFV